MGASLALSPIASFAGPKIHESFNRLLSEARSGNPRSELLLGYYYMNNLKDNQQAIYWLKQAAKKNYPPAFDMLSTIYSTRYSDIPLNYKKTYYYAKKGADLGQATSENNLGMLYYGGSYVKKDYIKAKELFEKSAAKGNAVGTFNLGQVYFYGNSVSKDKRNGINLYRKAALKGYAFAEGELAAVYQVGDGIPINFPFSYMWYKIAEINGSQKAKRNFFNDHMAEFKKQLPYCIAQGQANVGVMYSKGLAGLPKDGEKAMEWLQRANETDPNLAGIQLNLSKFYYAGIGTEQDTARAFHYAKKAASQPFGPAQQYLAQFYFNGVATKRDLVLAYAWLLKAKHTYNHPDLKFYAQYKAPCRPSPDGDALQNAKTAQAQMDAIKSHLTSAELSKAIKLEKTLK
jgi:TPR repeat protein